MHDSKNEQRYVDAARRGWLRAWELRIDGKMRAFMLWKVHRGVLYLDFAGYDRELARFSPGTVLLLRTFRDAIAEGVTAIDWGFGDYEYKNRFDARSWEDRHHYLFAPTARG